MIVTLSIFEGLTDPDNISKVKAIASRSMVSQECLKMMLHNLMG